MTTNPTNTQENSLVHSVPAAAVSQDAERDARRLMQHIGGAVGDFASSRHELDARILGRNREMTGTRRWLQSLGIVFALAVSVARAGAADVSGSYDGSLSMPSRDTGSVAGALEQTGAVVHGTLALSLGDAALDGVYYVNGTSKGSKVSLGGANGTGVKLKWVGTNSGIGLTGTVKLKGSTGKYKGAMQLTHRAAEPPPSSQTCDSPFFTGQVMGRVLTPVCANCHVAGGSAQSANFRVTPNDLIATQQSVDGMIDLAHPEESRLIKKPLGLIPHGGGQQLANGSDEINILTQWAQLVASNQQCNGGAGDVTLTPLAADDLILRASMDLRGKRPSLAELDQIDTDAGAYQGLVDQYLDSPEFLQRVKDVYNDALLVDREDDRDESLDETHAIYGEALELIAYIVKNDRPFTELGTADYTVANDLFQRDTNRMPFPMEPVTGSEWQPTHYTDGRPHAGLLSTSAFYEVWDTNDTNKNRRRANRWSIVFHCYNFLDTPVDVTRNVDNNDPNAVLNAVTTRSDCKACHDRLDPMASFIFPMDNAGLDGDAGPTDFFRGNPERWRTANKRPPAVYGVPGTDLRDMGRLLTSNDKFAQCQTKRAFKMLFLRDPKTNSELATAGDIANKWKTEDGYNFRKLVRRWMLSDAYRGRPQTNEAEWVRRASPERMELAIKDLTGFVWTRSPEDNEDDADPNSDPPRVDPVSLLTSEKEGFKIILGGINGVSVSSRSQSLNASVAMVQRKVAAMAADFVLRNDLALPDDQRVLLKGVTGSEDPTADEASLRTSIAGLERRFYGRRVATDSSVVSTWVTLYRNLYNDTTQGGTGRNQVPGTQAQRAWRGLLTAMLRSPRMMLY